MLRVVVDANIWISALLNSRRALAVVSLLEHDQFEYRVNPMPKSPKKNPPTVDQIKKPATVLERLGGKPSHVMHGGRRASSRAERKARVSIKGRNARQP